MSQQPRNRYYVLLAAGVFSLLVALLHVKQAIDLKKHSKFTKGFVRSFAEDQDKEGLYAPVFYVPVEDGAVTYQHNVYSRPLAWSVGEEVLFLYDTRAPTHVWMAGYFPFFGQVIIWASIAVLLIIPSAVHIFFHRFRRKQNHYDNIRR